MQKIKTTIITKPRMYCATSMRDCYNTRNTRIYKYDEAVEKRVEIEEIAPDTKKGRHLLKGK